MFKLGLVVNPYAGLGGARALKGSDGLAGTELPEQLRVRSRIERFLESLQHIAQIEFYTWGGLMGAVYLDDSKCRIHCLGTPAERLTTAKDTQEAVRKICAAKVDILIFVGGDGTARNVFDVVPSTQPVLGLPAGVKMQSSCFAISPTASAEVVDRLVVNGLVDVHLREVRDLDEAAYAKNQVRSKFYGELLVPEIGQFVQATKVGGLEVEELVINDIADDLDETREEILNAIKGAADIGASEKFKRANPKPDKISKPLSSAKEQSRKRELSMQLDLNVELPDIRKRQYSMIAIGSSTGGTLVIEKLLRQLPIHCPGIVIVQHMPEKFTQAYAKRINQLCEIEVKEAEHGDIIKPGTALLAPGGKHMRISRRKGVYSVNIFDGDSVNRHKPSVDVLFNSIAEFAKGDSLGVLLTGMGKDGAKGLLALKQSGSTTFAQAEEDSAIYGMPKAAMALGAASFQLNSSQIAKYISSLKA